MDIKKEHIASKKTIGELRGLPVIELKTTGGLHLVVAAKGGSFETLGTGPHRAIARYIAEKKEPDIDWHELSKSDYLDLESFGFLLPKYEELTDTMRALQGLLVITPKH